MDIAGDPAARSVCALIASTCLISSAALVACSSPEDDLFGHSGAVSTGVGASAATGSTTGSAGAGTGGEGAASSTGVSTGGQGADGGTGPGAGGAGGEGGVPPSCGNGQIDGDEACDGPDLGGKTCIDSGFSSPGSVSCTASCTIDDSACVATCDGAALERGENCDGSHLGGQSCVDAGYVQPEGLTCAADCQGVDASGCEAHCNGVLEPDEVCDGADLGTASCTDFGYVAPGGLSCAQCVPDPSGCKPTCGNFVIEPGEECDDGDLTSGDGCGATCQVEGDTCAGAIAVTVDLGPPSSVTGTTVGGGQHASVSCPAAALDRIYAVTAGDNGFLTATLTRPATTFDSVLYARLDCGSASTLLSCADSQGGMAGGGEVISFPVQDGQTVYVFVDGVAGEGEYELTLDLSTGASCSDPVPITVYEGSAMTFYGNTNNAGNDGQSSCGGGSADDVVYRLLRPQSGPVTVGLDATLTNYDSVLYARAACNFNTVSQCDNVDGASGELIALMNVTGGDPFYAWVDGFSGAEGNYALTVAP